jgi:hypothetical protein
MTHKVYAHKVGRYIGHNKTVCKLFDILDSKLPANILASIKEIPNPVFKFEFDSKDQYLLGTLFVYSDDHKKHESVNIDPSTAYHYDNNLWFMKNHTIHLNEKYLSLTAFIKDYQQPLNIDLKNPVLSIPIYVEDKQAF